MQITIENAMRLILSTLSLNKENNILPYFFIVGAGVSLPEIPSSHQIVDLCKKEVEKREADSFNALVAESESLKSNPMQYYSHWIELAYPNKVNRSTFFKTLITKSKISSATLMLAQILQSKRVASTVFTTNFDDKIKQALDLLGVRDIFVSENAMDNLVVSPNSKDTQIVHVHGAYNFYDCANLENEIAKVTNTSGTISSSQVLSNFLQVQAPIIIGYSGWENDVIMSCLKERLQYPTPLTYVWVCYSYKDFNNLPNWLKSSDNVLFVLPNKENDECSDDKIISESYISPKEPTTELDVLPATSFFSSIISNLKLLPPEIFTNPFSYYSNMLSQILPENEDVLHLKHWAERMKYLGSNDTEFDKLVKELEQASISKDFEKAIGDIKKLSETEITNADVKFICESLIMDFLKSEDIINKVELKVALHNATLDFVDKNSERLVTLNAIESVLERILFTRVRRNERVEHMAIIDRVCDLVSKYNSLKHLQLAASGYKSSLVEGESEQMALLKKIIDNCPSDTIDKHLLFLKCQALISIATLQDGEEAIETLKIAEEINEQINNEKRTQLLIAKSEVLYSIEDTDTQLQWIKELIQVVEQNNTPKNSIVNLNIMSNICAIDKETIMQVENIEQALISFVESNYDIENDDCEYFSMFVQIFTIICQIANEPSMKLEYCNKVFEAEKKFPCECGKYKTPLLTAISVYCSIPIAIVPDDLKIERLHKMQIIVDELSTIHVDRVYDATFNLAYSLGDKSKYDNSKLSSNMALVNELSEAYNFYSCGDFANAEQLYLKLLSCGKRHIEEVARINLAFMVRRNEADNSQFTLAELLENVSEGSALKQMNIVLQLLSDGHNESEEYNQAVSTLSTLSSHEINQAIECWSNVELVGAQESKVAMSILNSLAG